MAEETVILNLQINQAKALTDLEKTESAIIDLRKSQTDLTKAYKQGEVSQEEYVKENIRLRRSLEEEGDKRKVLNKELKTESNSRNAVRLQISKLTQQYDNLNKESAESIALSDKLEKEIRQLSEQLTKGDKAANLFKNQIGNYPEALKQTSTELTKTSSTFNSFTQNVSNFSQNVNVAGFSIGDLTGKLSSFITPATAVLGVVSALGAAYANSAIGARDLAKAQNLAAASLSIVSNDLANLVSPNSGDGLLTMVTKAAGDYFKTIVNISTYGLLNDYLSGVEEQTKKVADAQERLNDLSISRAFAQGDAKNDERRAELLRRIRDDEEQTIKTRIEASKQIDQILETSGKRSQIIIQSQIDAIKESTVGYELNRQAQLEVAQLTAEIADKEEEITGKLTENVTARRNILKAIQEEREKTRQAIKFSAPTTSGDVTFSDTPEATGASSTLPSEEQLNAADQAYRDYLNNTVEAEVDRARKHRDFLDFMSKQDENYANFVVNQEKKKQEAIGYTLQTAMGLFAQQTDAYQALASADALVNTYKAANLALGSYPPPFSYIAMAATIAAGLGNVAQINGIQFAEGGFTGAGGKYEPAGIVHKGEYVVPQNVTYSPAAQPHIAALDNMRLKGYADGGYVTRTNTAPAQSSLALMNAMKNLPPVFASWIEGERVGRRVQFKENLSKLG